MERRNVFISLPHICVHIIVLLSPTTCCQGKEKIKKIPLRESRVKYRDLTEKMSDKAFVLVDGAGNQTKYSAKTASVAQAWVEKIRQVISQEEVRLRQEVNCRVGF